jgi:hypothetical protein
MQDVTLGNPDAGGDPLGKLGQYPVDHGDQAGGDPADLSPHSVGVDELASEGKSFAPGLLIGELKSGQALTLDRLDRLAPNAPGDPNMTPKLAAGGVGVDPLRLPDDHQRLAAQLVLRDQLGDARARHANGTGERSFGDDVRLQRGRPRPLRESLGPSASGQLRIIARTV